MIDAYCIDYDDYLAVTMAMMRRTTIMVMPCFPIGENVH